MTALTIVLAMISLMAFDPPATAGAGAKGLEKDKPADPDNDHGEDQGAPQDRWLLPALLGRTAGKLLMEVDRFDMEFCTRSRCPRASAPTPSGSTAGSSATAVVVFRRIGPKVLMIEPNLRFRADQQPPGRTAGRGGVVCQFGALGLQGRSRGRGPRARRRHGLLPARRARRRRSPAGNQAGKLQAGRAAERA